MVADAVAGIEKIRCAGAALLYPRQTARNCKYRKTDHIKKAAQINEQLSIADFQRTIFQSVYLPKNLVCGIYFCRQKHCCFQWS